MTEINFKDFDLKVLGFLLMAYVAAQIIFGLATNVHLSNLVNILLLIFYLFIAIYRKHRGLYLGKVSVMFAIFTLIAFWSAGYASDPWLSISWFRSLSIITINVIVLYDIIRRYRLGLHILTGFIIASYFNHMIALNIIEINNPGQENYIRFIGTQGNPNIFSTTILLGLVSSLIMFELNDNWVAKLVNLLNIPLCFYGIILSMSRKGIAIGLILLIVLVFMNLSSLRGMVAVFMITLISLLAINQFLDLQNLNVLLQLNASRIESALNSFGANKLDDGSIGLRLKYVNLSLDLFFQSPIYGHGFNNFRYYSGFHYTHNNYLEVLTGLGLIGFTVFYCIHFQVFRNSLRIENKRLSVFLLCGLVVILVGDIGTVSYLKKHTMYMLVFLYGFSKQMREDQYSQFLSKDKVFYAQK